MLSSETRDSHCCFSFNRTSNRSCVHYFHLEFDVILVVAYLQPTLGHILNLGNLAT